MQGPGDVLQEAPSGPAKRARPCPARASLPPPPLPPAIRGLRAIKSVLVVAGSLLRAEEGQVESQVLFRALRDFNIPKILAPVRGVVQGWGQAEGPRAAGRRECGDAGGRGAGSATP
jgi:hypothetical protein